LDSFMLALPWLHLSTYVRMLGVPG
jgi:hypothetical protein